MPCLDAVGEFPTCLDGFGEFPTYLDGFGKLLLAQLCGPVEFAQLLAMLEYRRQELLQYRGTAQTSRELPAQGHTYGSENTAGDEQLPYNTDTASPENFGSKSIPSLRRD